MATEFTLKSKAYDGRYIVLSLKQTKNPSANTSKVDWTLTVTGGESNYYSTGPTTAKLNGVQLCYYPRKSYATHEFPAAKGTVSGSTTVKHAYDGSCSVPVSLTTAIYTTTTFTVTGTWTLDANPRQSTICATSGNIEKTILVAVSRYAGGFTHSLQYSFGSETGWVGTDGRVSATEVKHTDTSVAFTLPESFYDQIPEAKSGEGQLTCYTYSGSTLVGTSTCTFTAYTDKDLCAPTVSGTVIDCNEKTLALTGDEDVLVRYRSTARCAITAEAKKGASLVRKKIGSATVTEDVREISYIENTDILFAARDSRGYETQVVVSTPIVPYIRLTNNASVKRTDPTSGNAVVRLRGSCFYGSFGAVENSLVARYHIGGRDTVEISVPIREDNTYDVSFTLSGFDYDQDLKFHVTMADALSTAAKTLPVSRGIPVFDWGENDFAFHVPVHFDQSVSGAYIRTKRLSGTADITLQSRFASFDTAATARQSVFLFGWDNGRAIAGLLCLNYNGTAAWSGSEGVTVAAGENGKFTITLPGKAYDWFTLISAEYISL